VQIHVLCWNSPCKQLMQSMTMLTGAGVLQACPLQVWTQLCVRLCDGVHMCPYRLTCFHTLSEGVCMCLHNPCDCYAVQQLLGARHSSLGCIRPLVYKRHPTTTQSLCLRPHAWL